MQSDSNSQLLKVENLRVYFHNQGRDGRGLSRAVDGVSLDVLRGEIVCIVGESGSGKSVTALSLLKLIQSPGRIEEGSQAIFDGRDLLTLPEQEIREIRGNRISMVFQEPMSALNPVLQVGEQIAEVIRAHSSSSRKEAWDRAVTLLAETGIPDAAKRAKQYPHQLSGGMRQRVMIAVALAMNPALIIADEPTTALDVTIQAQILDLLKKLQARHGTSILLITHDLGVVSEIANRVFVMYGGEIVERGDVKTIFSTPHHPYTQGLLAAVPQLGKKASRLKTIPGMVPPATAWPRGCRFRERCSYAWDRCQTEHPRLYNISHAGDSEPHFSRCHLADEAERATPDGPALHGRLTGDGYQERTTPDGTGSSTVVQQP